MRAVSLTAICMIATTIGPARADTVTIRGIVAVAPVAEATVTAYRTSSGNEQSLATAVSDSEGNWSLELPTEAAQDFILLRAQGGRYQDPVTNEIRTLGRLYSAWQPGAETVAITPVSSVLSRRWLLVGEADSERFAQMRQRFTAKLGFDPLTQLPDTSSSAGDAAWAHAASIGGIAAILGGSSAIRNSEAGTAGPQALLDALIDDLTDGVLDGVSADDAPVIPGEGSHPLPVLESLNRPLLTRAIERYVAAHRETPLAPSPNFDSWRPDVPAATDKGAFSNQARWRVQVSGEFESSGNKQSVSGDFARLKGADMPRPGEPLDCKRLRWLLGPNFSDMRSIYHDVSCRIVGRYKTPRKMGQGFTAELTGHQLVSHGNALATVEFTFRGEFSWLSD